MSYSIRWTSESEKTFAQNLEYLSRDWDNKVINQFLDRVEEILDTIKLNPRVYPLYREEPVRKWVVHERLVLYYKIIDKENIDLLMFWNTY